ncbi:hypothetical protein FOQG_17259 [Fusarium oxysporum f. sp. raphani 54005]|uniref:Uncharacterized protein n=3 Tax=Fusarium oxysporum species complex TaxID=171631 RepID=X0B8E9_FUSOX|nr:uncharacterized protein FOIG_09098 [Fusarium odoratissimum NRRL 54006]EXK78051.1 hypothetical protein FOQG_17259 [Fusarium oxysporum f. sp. raphani 54005]EXL99232.1 hypothetical protein FOIG_09098 [Fusarium odoratissimum NRRL 54006]EXM20341.1 hypothetical protein FOTG_11710 [Fusarium oxysporum f. sp. vasinfectum 25433]KAK2130453.1 hypothetical protein NOF04DRAFT_5814 [Fusarium oxysporum II5]
MKFSILTALTAIVGSAAAANQAVVTNDCSGTIYVQSWPYNGGAPGPLVTLKPGQKFSENLRSTGSTVKIATTKTLTNPLFFGYSSTSKPNYVYCKSIPHKLQHLHYLTKFYRRVQHVSSSTCSLS